MNLARLRAETGGFWNYCGCEVDMGVIQRDECYLWQQRESLAHHWTGKALSEAAAGFNERQSFGSLAPPNSFNYTWLVNDPLMVIVLITDLSLLCLASLWVWIFIIYSRYGIHKFIEKQYCRTGNTSIFANCFNQYINFTMSIERSPEKHNPEVNNNELLSYSGAVMNRKVPWLPFFLKSEKQALVVLCTVTRCMTIQQLYFIWHLNYFSPLSLQILRY